MVLNAHLTILFLGLWFGKAHLSAWNAFTEQEEARLEGVGEGLGSPLPHAFSFDPDCFTALGECIREYIVNLLLLKGKG